MAEKERATSEEREKAAKLIEEGKVEWSEVGEEYFAKGGTIARHNPDLTLTSATLTSCWGPWQKTYKDGHSHGNKGGFEISWGTVSAGFGVLTICITNEGTIKVDSECMDKEFCLKVLAKLLESVPEEEFCK